MKHLSVVLLLLFSVLVPRGASAQGARATDVRFGPALPACDAATRWKIFAKTTSQKGLYLCTDTGWSLVGGITPGVQNQIAIYGANGMIVVPDNLLMDSGTALAYTGTGGISAPSFTTTNTAAAGAIGFGQGPTNAAGQCGQTPVNCIGWQGPTSVGTNGWFTMPSAPGAGLMMFGAPSSGVTPGTLSGDANHTATPPSQTASITTTNLCPSAAGACNSSGTYVVQWVIRSTTTCAIPGPAGVTLTIGWTDDVGAKTFVVSQEGTGSSGSSVALGATTNFGQGSFVVRSTGSVAITYAMTYTACTSGTGTYNLDAFVYQGR